MKQRGRKTTIPNNPLRQVSIDMIVDSRMTTKQLDALVQSALRGTLLQIVKARLGIVEVKHTLTDKGPMYIPIVKENENGQENASGADGGNSAGLSGDNQEGNGGSSQA